MPYELLIKSNTIISNLGKFEPMEIVDTTPKTIELSDVLNATKNRIILRGYVKTNFAEVYNNNMNKIIGCGAITDGTFKLEIHVINFSNDDYTLLDIRKGDHVEIIGIMQTTGSE
ncbi:uncharacterized protein LOC112639896 [Camponotus floridanus]|nr:uncharacterized protein LOC112639896 [Camponotus floridanus]